MIKKTSLAIPVLAAVAAASILTGCGSSDSSSGDDPASVAPADTPVFIEGKIQPTGDLKTNLEEIASRVAGVDDLGETIVSLVEQSALESGEPFDFDKEIQPWLGESAGIFLMDYEGDDFETGAFAIAVTDTGEAQDFIDKQAKSEEVVEDESYEGIDYKFGFDDGDAIGIVGNFIVLGDSKEAFEAAVDASKGDNLTDSDNYNSITPSNPDGSLANVYVDIAGLVREAGDQVDPDTRSLLEASGIEIERSAALLSLIPGSNNVEIDIASKFGDEQDAVPTEDASEMLGSLPADSVAAIGVGDLGESLGMLVDTIDEQGIPGEVPAGKFKSTLKKAGIDLEKIASGLGDGAVFARGANLLTLSGALVIEAKDPSEARNTVSNIGTLLRASGTPGVTAVNGEAAGFSVRDRDLGRQPLVVASKGDLIAVGYGLQATLAGLDSGKGPTLSGSKAYNEALNSLGGTPITGFAAGRPAVRLIEGLIEDTDEKEEFEAAAPYLNRIPFLAIGSEAKDDVIQAKVVLGITK